MHLHNAAWQLRGCTAEPGAQTLCTHQSLPMLALYADGLAGASPEREEMVCASLRCALRGFVASVNANPGGKERNAKKPKDRLSREREWQCRLAKSAMRRSQPT